MSSFKSSEEHAFSFHQIIVLASLVQREMITLAKLHKFIIKIFRTVFSEYPKMQISFEKFKYKLPRIQKYITNSKYWKNNNKNGEKMEFIRVILTFSIQHLGCFKTNLNKTSIHWTPRNKRYFFDRTH
jgi:hypothetical protein